MEPTSEPSPSPNGAADSAGAHLDAIALPTEPWGDAPAGDEDLPLSADGKAAPAVLTRDQWFATFRGTFGVVNAMTYKPPLAALQIAKDDAQARAAADALYDICDESPWLRWMISPRSKWMQRVIVIGTFGAQLYSTTTAELRDRRRTPPPTATDERTAAEMNGDADDAAAARSDRYRRGEVEVGGEKFDQLEPEKS